MFKSFIVITFRNLLKYRLYSLINLAGLGTGITCFAVLLMMIQHELSYDSFHQHRNRIFRVTEAIGEGGIGEHSASLPFPAGPQLQADFPNLIQHTVRLFNFQSPTLSVSYGDARFNERRMFFADSSFFSVFSFRLAQGNPDSALFYPNTVVISHEAARRYFGADDPLGKVLKFQGSIPLTVTGVLPENMPQSHISFDLLASFSTLRGLTIRQYFNNWLWNPCWTYIKLNRYDAQAELDAALPDFVRKHFLPEMADDIRLSLQPLTDIHLHSSLDYEISPNADIKYLYIFGGMAIFILFVAGINYMNLSTAQGAVRSRQVIVRKSIGADGRTLFWEFLGESAVLGAMAVVLAFIIVEVVAPFLSDLSGNPLDTSIRSELNKFITIVIAGLLLGMLFSIYPAYYLSSFELGSVSGGGSGRSPRSGRIFRSVLVVVQFSISVILLISTFVSRRQLDFMLNADLGFEKEHILILPIANTRITAFFDEFKNDLRAHKAIEAVTATEEVLGISFQTHEFTTEKNTPGEYTVFPSMVVSYDFVNTCQIELIAGRDFLRPVPRRDSIGHLPDETAQRILTDDYNAVLINEAMVSYMGWESPEKALGKTFSRKGSSEKVVGVLKDFHFSSLREQISPFVIDLANQGVRRSYLKYMVVRMAPNLENEALAHVRDTWQRYNSSQPVEYFLLSEQLEAMYIQEHKLWQIASWFAAIAVVIACMGLFALSSFVVERQKRDVGIRKALGAYTEELALYLASRFIYLVLTSIAVSIPLGYYLAWRWLSSFPYHIRLSADIFVWSGLVLLAISTLTISYHTIKAARNSPTESLVQR